MECGHGAEKPVLRTGMLGGDIEGDTLLYGLRRHCGGQRKTEAPLACTCPGLSQPVESWLYAYTGSVFLTAHIQSRSRSCPVF